MEPIANQVSICHIQLGTTPKPMIEWKPGHEDLFKVALGWLREDRELRRVKEASRGRIRGPKNDVSQLAETWNCN